MANQDISRKTIGQGFQTIEIIVTIEGQEKMDITIEIVYVVCEYIFTNEDLICWWMDFRAIRHITKMKTNVHLMRELILGSKKVYMDNNTYSVIMGIGSCLLNGGTNVLLKDVFYVSQMRRKLLFIPTMT